LLLNYFTSQEILFSEHNELQTALIATRWFNSRECSCSVFRFHRDSRRPAREKTCVGGEWVALTKRVMKCTCPFMSQSR